MDRLITCYTALPLIFLGWMMVASAILTTYDVQWLLDIPTNGLGIWLISFIFLRVITAPFR